MRASSFAARLAFGVVALATSATAQVAGPLPGVLRPVARPGFAWSLVGSAYVAPTLATPLFIADGDSRTANGGGAGYAPGAGFSATAIGGYGYAGYIGLGGGNVGLNGVDWNFGVGSSTTAGISARGALTGIYCNGGNASIATGICFTGSKITTTAATAVGTTSGTNNVLHFAPANVSSALVGKLVYTPTTVGQSAFGPLTSVQSVNTSTGDVTLSGFATVAIPSGASMAFVDPVTVNTGFAANLGAAGAGWSVTDPYYALGSSGQNTICSNPAQIVTYQSGTNDGQFGDVATSLTNIAFTLDQLGPQGCNKIVVLGNETPKGVGAGHEFGTVNGSNQYVIAMTGFSSPAVYDVQSVAFAPAGTGGARSSGSPAFAAGPGDGVALTASCPTPASGQYCLSGSTLTFNASDIAARTDKTVSVWYRFLSGGGATPAFLVTIHNWVNSASCVGFTDPASARTFAINGAQCNRPWVHIVDTWTPVVDPAAGTNGLPAYGVVPYCRDGLALHERPRCGRLEAKAFSAAITGIIGTSTPAIALPTTNNVQVSGTSGSSTASIGATSCSALGTATNTYLTGLTPTASTGQYDNYATARMILPTSTGITSPVVVDCVDKTKNYLHMATAANTAGNANFSGSGAAMWRADAADLLFNGLFDHTLQSTAADPCPNCTTAAAFTGINASSTTIRAVPAGWTLTVGGLTDVANGVADVRYGIATSPFDASGAGPDAFVIQLLGRASSAWNVQLKNALGSTVASTITQGDKHRGLCKVTTMAGPNGQLWSAGGVTITSGDQKGGTTAAFNGQIAGNTLTVNSVTAGSVGVGSLVAGSGVTLGTVVTAGTTITSGGSGTLTVSGAAQTIAAEAMTSPPSFVAPGDPSGLAAYTTWSGITGTSGQLEITPGDLLDAPNNRLVETMLTPPADTSLMPIASPTFAASLNIAPTSPASTTFPVSVTVFIQQCAMDKVTR